MPHGPSRADQPVVGTVRVHGHTATIDPHTVTAGTPFLGGDAVAVHDDGRTRHIPDGARTPLETVVVAVVRHWQQRRDRDALVLAAARPRGGEVPGLAWAQGQSYCATFTSWVGMRAGVATLFPRTADCSAAVTWYSSTNRVGKVCIQIEVLARAGTPFTGYWKPGPNFRKLMAAIRSYGVPDTFPMGALAAKYGDSNAKRTRDV
ncbi:hypothetical protein ACH4Y0_02075 [Streptomyces sp. NPDC020707]|uniref:hypothetical protein n=1 Tax=Streptomyces sp. NPDC020707 TaxID=3365084 RepID=UPI003789E528